MDDLMIPVMIHSTSFAGRQPHGRREGRMIVKEAVKEQGVLPD